MFLTFQYFSGEHLYLDCFALVFRFNGLTIFRIQENVILFSLKSIFHHTVLKFYLRATTLIFQI